jgi:hypothetical protein
MRRGGQRVLWYLAAALTFWSFGYTVTRGSDLWWHLAAGRWAWEHRAIPLADPWSFTRAGAPWLNDAWLSDFIFQLWTLAFGVQSLVWWKWTVLVTTLVLLLRLVRRLAVDPLASHLAVLLGVATAAPFLDLRPQLYSFLGYVLLLEGTIARPRPSPLLPLLFLLWANLHALVVFGAVALGVTLAPAVVSGPPPARRRALAVGGASLLACLANPNGTALVLRPLGYALGTSPFRDIGEWLPPFAPGGIRASAYPWAIAAFAAATAFVVGRRARDCERTASAAAVALGLLTLAMSLRSRRFVPLFAISQSLLVGPALARLLPPLPRPAAVAAPLAALALGAAWLAPYPRSSAVFPHLVAEDLFPVETCNFVETNRLSGRVFAYYNWGGYVNLRTAGRLAVFIDGRADMVFDAEVYRHYRAVLDLAPGWRAIVDASGADYVLWPWDHEQQIEGLVRSGRWRPLYEDHVSVLLERADRPPAAGLRPTPDSAYRRLALARRAVRERRLAEAERLLEDALALDPELGSACRMLARLQAVHRSGARRVPAERCRLERRLGAR